jgi:Xaa-Pro aminopeptidase
MSGVAMVFPTDGRAPVAIGERIRPNQWVTEVQSVSRVGMTDSWAGTIVKTLLDFGMERARIGVVGLGHGQLAHVTAIDGVTTHTAYAGVLAALPQATFASATDIVGAARYRKGEEEIECLRHAAGTAVQVLEGLVQDARPGLPEATLYAHGMRRLLELGSEYFPVALQSGPLGQRRYRHQGPQLGHTLDAGWVIEAEVGAVWGGQVAEEAQSIVLGPLPEPHVKAGELQRKWFGDMIERLTPGRDIAELSEWINSLAHSGGLRPAISVQSSGYGDDGPRLRSGDPTEGLNALRIEANTTWTCQIGVQDGAGLHLTWGSSILVTERGPIQLVDRQPGLMSIT